MLLFQQNETAVDVARRKEYAEIILIITSQPKVCLLPGNCNSWANEDSSLSVFPTFHVGLILNYKIKQKTSILDYDM